MDNSEFEKENEALQNIIKKYEDIMEYYNLRIEAIPKLYKDNPSMIENSILMYAEKLRMMEKSIDKPYFARLDFAIDEAQDFGDFSFYALKSLLRNATFSIFGDLAQPIYQYRGINNWQNVANNTFKEKCDMKYLLKSYRTTTEIMNSANNITNYINLNVAKPVIRHGKNVKYINYSNTDEQIDKIKSILEQYKESEYKTVAVICKDEEEATFINDKLRSDNIKINNITDSDTQYNGGICTITSYLAKGLEFDGVIVANASEGEYNSNKDIDMKLLYVSMTRPLHELNVLYNKNIVKPLQEEVEIL